MLDWLRRRRWARVREEGGAIVPISVSAEERPTRQSSPAMIVEVLIKQLDRRERTKVRVDAAGQIAQLGPSAIAAIPELVLACVDASSELREAAAKALAAIAPDWRVTAEARAALDNVVVQLKSPSGNQSSLQLVRGAASGLLVSMGPSAVPALLKALEEDVGGNSYVLHVLRLLGKHAAAARNEIACTLTSEHLAVRIAAAEALTVIGPPIEALGALIRGLGGRFERREIALCVARLGPEAEHAAPALLPLLADGDDAIREAASNALMSIGPRAVPALIRLLQTRDLQVLNAWINLSNELSIWRAPAASGKQAPDSEAARSKFWWFWFSQHEEIERLRGAHLAAVSLLAQLGAAAPEAIPAIVGLFADEDPHLQVAALDAVARLGGPAASYAGDIVRMLAVSNRSIRAAAAKAFASVCAGSVPESVRREGADALVRQLGSSESDGAVAVAAVAQLGQVAVPALIEALGTGGRVTRENAIEALGKMGATARDAVPVLERASLHDESLWVQKRAKEALPRIKAGPAA